MKMQFEWDENKSRINRAKHGVDFEFARKVWSDPNFVLYEDRASGSEQRCVAIGDVGKVTVLLVVHTYRGHDEEIVRIISARKATPHERKLYHRGPNA